MRKSMPLRWIEEAEARQVLATAQSEAPPPPFAPVATKAPWTERVRRWVAAAPAASRAAHGPKPSGAGKPGAGNAMSGNNRPFGTACSSQAEVAGPLPSGPHAGGTPADQTAQLFPDKP